jgi:hypothetical protein
MNETKQLNDTNLIIYDDQNDIKYEQNDPQQQQHQQQQGEDVKDFLIEIQKNTEIIPNNENNLSVIVFPDDDDFDDGDNKSRRSSIKKVVSFNNSKLIEAISIELYSTERSDLKRERIKNMFISKFNICREIFSYLKRYSIFFVTLVAVIIIFLFLLNLFSRLKKIRCYHTTAEYLSNSSMSFKNNNKKSDGCL